MRLQALDGLRGLAAVVVLIHHAMLTIPVFALPYLSDQRVPGGATWVLTHTPLHLLWDGHAAVYIFFVLSGLVLTLPVIERGREFSWDAYYPQRLLRLYLPVWVAVLLAIGFLTLVPRNPQAASLWLQSLPQEVTLAPVILDLTLVAGNGPFLSPLWSLRWEILFSLAFPAFAFTAIRFARWWRILLLACVIAITIGGWKSWEAAMYLPMFMIGCVLATTIPRLQVTQRRRRRYDISLVVLSILLLSSPWAIVEVPGLSGLTGPFIGIAAIGAGLAVYSSLTVSAVRTWLTTPVMKWLGRISFSLYLVHEPVVVASAHFFGENRLLAAAAVSLLVSVALAQVFYRLVEVPTHRIARRVGMAIRARHQPTRPVRGESKSSKQDGAE